MEKIKFKGGVAAATTLIDVGGKLIDKEKQEYAIVLTFRCSNCSHEYSIEERDDKKSGRILG